MSDRERAREIVQQDLRKQAGQWELPELTDAIAAALAQARAEGPGWQPIETAPRDGTRILIADADGNVDVASYEQKWTIRQEWVRKTRAGEDVYRTIREDDGYWTAEDIYNPIHWMPLPTPPRALAEGHNRT